MLRGTYGGKLKMQLRLNMYTGIPVAEEVPTTLVRCVTLLNRGVCLCWTRRYMIRARKSCDGWEDTGDGGSAARLWWVEVRWIGHR
jgi:hypothetical protein